MSKKLGGSLFIYNGIQQDYSFVEAIKCLQELCDEVSVVDAGSQDGTVEVLKTLEDSKTKITYLSKDEWDAHHGREKLAHFMNRAIELLDTEWQFALQADECIHENSFDIIRQAIEYNDVDAYFSTRYNLWKTPYYMLNVEQSKKPCSTEIIRLAKTQYRAVDDGEQIAVPSVHIPGDIRNIEVYHTGFVRDPVKMLVKVKHMLTEVFGWSNDVRAENCDKFMPERFFSDEDIIPIPRPLPKFIQQWAADRYPGYK